MKILNMKKMTIGFQTIPTIYTHGLASFGLNNGSKIEFAGKGKQSSCMGF